MIDFTLNLNTQAWAVLHALGALTPGFAETERGDDGREDFDVYFTTRAWYNGRERGFVLKMDEPRGSRSFCVAWAESRGSEDIVVYNWIQDSCQSEWSVDWKSAKNFPKLRVDRVVKYIYKTLEKVYPDFKE